MSSTVSVCLHETIEDTAWGKLKLQWEPVDVVYDYENEQWVGFNADVINTYSKMPCGLTWPKRLTHLTITDGTIELGDPCQENGVSSIHTDYTKHMEESKKALRLQNVLLPITPFIIHARPGTRLTARYLHEIE